MRTILTILLATTLAGSTAYAMHGGGGHVGAGGGISRVGDHVRAFRGDRDDRMTFRDRDHRRFRDRDDRFAFRDRDDFRRNRFFIPGWWLGGVYGDACVPGTWYWRHHCQ